MASSPLRTAALADHSRDTPSHARATGPRPTSYLSTHDDSQYQYQQPHTTHHAPGTSRFTEDWDASQRGTSILDGHRPRSADMSQRRSSFASGAPEEAALARGNTLRKKASMRRSGSLGRSGSRRSVRAGSVRSLALQPGAEDDNEKSAFYCPVPTGGNPTDALATRFQTWRKFLKDLIAFFKEVQSHYEARAKATNRISTAANNLPHHPSLLAPEGGLNDAVHIIRRHHRTAGQDATRAQEIEADVILALSGLRSDLHQKIKEIRHLSGDFKNSVDKEMDGTRKAVDSLQDVLGQAEVDAALATGKQDPYLMRLAVDRQVERQIDEETYLHQAYLNLETSGRELEAIVVGEVQKAYNAYASILKREADAAYSTVDELRSGPVGMPKDREWTHFMSGNDQFVDPSLAVRSPEDINYPGRDHEACQELRAGLLERKSKYLKSYTAGWYVLSPTHLHEFKSADKAQGPVMSLYLPEQKLGSHSKEGGSSQKFLLKGRQTGGMHRGHTWVFRAESHDTMMAWYADLKVLTERSAKERSEMLVARGLSVRSGSGASRRSTSSDAGVVDEEDEEPFAAGAMDVSSRDGPEKRPQAGGRFPSDIQVNAQRGMQVRGSPSTASSGLANGDAFEGTGAGAGAYAEGGGYGDTSRAKLDDAPSHAAMATREAARDGVNPYTSQPLYQPTPVHGAAPAAAIYQYQTPGRETLADGGAYFAGGVGTGAAAGYAAGQAGQYGAQSGNQVPSSEAPVPPASGAGTGAAAGSTAGQTGQYGAQGGNYAPSGEAPVQPTSGMGTGMAAGYAAGQAGHYGAQGGNQVPSSEAPVPPASGAGTGAAAGSTAGQTGQYGAQGGNYAPSGEAPVQSTGGMGTGMAAGYAAGQAGHYGAQGGNYVTSSEAPIPPMGAGAETERRENTVEEQPRSEDEPRQWINRTSTSNMHVPGQYPKSATTVAEGNGAAR